LGDCRKLTVDYLFGAYGLLVDVAKSYDTRIASKFGLTAQKLSSAVSVGKGKSA
jgi:hypothetical protein